MKSQQLYCVNCKKHFSLEEAHYRCDICNEPLEVEEISTGKIKKGNILNQTILDRYEDFFPYLEKNNYLSLGEGFTPLTEAKSLEKNFGIGKIYIKNESQNPTWSFKDRGTYAGVQHALQMGYKKIGTVSTGNMAASVAAYGVKANMETFIFVDKKIEHEKLNPIAIYSPHLIKVEGDYGRMYFESLKIGNENGIYFINSDAPIRVEGSKTIAYEICEQLNFEIPDYIIIPTSAGGNARGIDKGFREFKACGYIDKVPRLIIGQASGCSPIYNAYISNAQEISRINSPSTIAHAIENPYPPSGNRVLKMIRENGGGIVAVSDEDILKAQKTLSGTGIFGQPESAVPLAVVERLKRDNFFRGDETIVCIVTGGGLKYTAAFEKHDLKSMECKLEDLKSFMSFLRTYERS